MTQLHRYLMAVISGLGLALPFIYPGSYLLTWCGLVPLIFAVQGQTLMQVYGLSLTAGFVMFAVAAHSITDFISLYNGVGGWASVLLSVLFWGYCGQLMALAFVLVRWLEMRLQLSWLLLLPVCLAFFFSRFPMVFPVQLAESQSQFTSALQALDLLGTAGLDVVIVTVNVGLFTLFRRSRSVSAWQLCAILPVALWFGYGLVMQPVWERRIADWPIRTLGIVQSDELPSADIPPPRPGYSRGYPPEMALTQQLSQHNVDLVVWPETRYKGYFAYPWVQDTFQRLLADMQVPVVFQDTEIAAGRAGAATYNTAVMLSADGELQASYRKIERMPLAEYVPGLEYWPRLKSHFYGYFSDFFTDFLPGESFGRFRLEDMQMVPVICFEVMLSEFVARAVQGEQGRQNVGNLLLVLSNSGWFGDSVQAFQQLNASVLRSVENRIPLLYVSNRGPSGLILPSGEIVYQSPFLQQLGVALRVPYAVDNQGSFYSRHPSLLLHCLSGLMCGFILLAGWRSPGRSAVNSFPAPD